ncbi:MAG TPA: protein kinase [Thermoanaerobaculia bacterium]|nr:protein kinase [Thermoanaerobaculia bacterium]
MKTKPLVMLCWIQAVIAAFFVLLNFYVLVNRPMPGFDYSRASGKVLDVVPGGPAERTGITKGDTILSINGHAVAPGIIPLYFTRAGDAVPVVFEHAGIRRAASLTLITLEEQRHLALRAGEERAISAIASYLNFPLHVWMLGLGIALLVLRPANKDARLSALTLVYWAGSLFLYQTSGLPASFLNIPMILIDAWFCAAFFAAVAHFALIFPSERVGRLRPIWEVVPYVVSLPIFIETLLNDLQRLRGDVRPAALPFRDASSSIGTVLLVAALITLGVRLTRMQDPNARRRLQLVFLSLLPATVTFSLGFLGDALRLGYTFNSIVRVLNTPMTMLGAALYGYAVVRHRLYNISVLVRRSLQYALARGTLFVLMSLPVIGLAIFVYAHRRESLADLLTGMPSVYLLLILPLVAMIHYRKRLLESLDRRFFREQYDARRVLQHVVSIIRGGSDMLALSRAALDEIDKALHPKHISLWQADPEAGQLHRGFYRGGDAPFEVVPLATTGTLASLLITDDDPLDVFHRSTRALLQRLPADEREWLRVSDAFLIVPLLIEKRLVGLMVLGERKSEEPYSREDRELLRTLGAQLALTLDYTRLKQSPSLVWSAPVHVYTSDVVQLCPKCGRCYAADASQCELDQEALVPESGVPRIIEDKYIITRLLGRGGMGSVYLATQKRLNRPVAIKVLLSHLVGSASMRSRFEREARIVARLRHPAIVTIHDFGVLASGHAYLVMEYLDGETLRKVIAGGPQPLPAAMTILRPVGEAVDAAHNAGIVHRDLKPENIMLVRDHGSLPAPRVLDFGLAKMSSPIGEDEATFVQSGHSAGVVGTLMYMAPEVLSGHTADAKSDQYSLGLIAYELIAGEHPLGQSTDLASVVRGHTDLPLIPITDRVPDIPRNVADALHRALAKKADQRFRSVGEFIAAMG